MPALNPWLALPDGGPSPVLARRLRAAHESLVTQVPGDAPAVGHVRSVVWDSWRRSQDSGVDPDGTAPPVDLLDDDLLSYRAAHPLAAVMPVIRRLLVADAEVDRMIVAVTDAAGRMLWVEGDARLRDRAAGMHFVEGASWGEDVAGTNAPGTALALDHAVQIYGGEHFRRPVQPWSCSAAPVHDPNTGALLGAIDVTGGDHVASPHVLTLVRATAAAAEAELRWLSRHHPAPVGPRPAAVRLEVLGRDRARLTTSTTVQELSLRHSELLVLLAEAAARGEGRTAEQLAAECHDGAAATVTVRAELSRLRRLVGGDVVGSRPYRLLGPVRTDVEEVRAQLTRGAPAAALDRYRGPLLPGSRAPGVRVARARLADDLRGAVLAAGRPDLLLRYSERPEAAEDLAVWQACLALLPPGGRRNAAAAQVQRLRAGVRAAARR
ncbi:MULTISPECIES: GAF domain-containing protein [unclassified Modestobacter]|uniref:GAF domain-containing protein n=1 Tax=unclassified Modestobacter TaxID=2643866 RepID=UPI0022AA3A17|nr:MULTISPECIES: GAF domain-containing protein [unclassified Modestobacter]MCZ2823220.1 GAF domain-containing protein [Modestobacter sp. VKM Ac-2981]MCZ2851465.1 GAF domain-containing protein [Modestobacter sp. VKM Ac-2982]